MSSARYFFGVLIAISLPPAILWWFIIHPFVGFWRARGVHFTMVVNVVILFAGISALYAIRGPLMGRDLGTHWVLWVMAGVCVISASWIALKRSKYLTFWILMGGPEVEEGGHGGELLTEGPYAVIRNPRYVEIVLGTMAYVTFANWTGPYLVAIGTILAIHAVVLLEERELVQRFGEEFEAYRSRVPRYIPNWGKS